MISRQSRVRRQRARVDIAGKLELGLWWVAWVVAPFYVTSPGLPHIGDGVLFLLFAGMVATGRLVLPSSAQGPVTALSLFVGYAMLVGSAWATLTGAWEFVVPVAYIAFNLALLLLTVSLHYRWGDRFLRLTLGSWAASLAIQGLLVMGLLVVVMPPGYNGSRGLVFFNDPNQLGTFGVAGAVLVVLLSRQSRVGAVFEYALLPVCAVLVVSSASRSALLAYGTLLAIYLLTSPRRIVAAVAIGALLAYFLPWHMVHLDLAEERLRSTVGQPASSLALDRGYTRMIEHPGYMVLGAGEGMNERFGQEIEIHSMPGTLLFCYGIPGAGLFIAACWAVYRRATISSTLMLLPLLVLSLSLNTLRMRVIWLNLAFTLSTAILGTRTPWRIAGRIRRSGWACEETTGETAASRFVYGPVCDRSRSAFSRRPGL